MNCTEPWVGYNECTWSSSDNTAQDVARHFFLSVIIYQSSFKTNLASPGKTNNNREKIIGRQSRFLLFVNITRQIMLNWDSTTFSFPTVRGILGDDKRQPLYVAFLNCLLCSCLWIGLDKQVYSSIDLVCWGYHTEQSNGSESDHNPVLYRFILQVSDALQATRPLLQNVNVAFTQI